MPKMKTSFKGLVQLLAKSLYPEPDVFIRELIQNAHDSIKLRKVDEPEMQGVIEIFTDADARTITFTDNGKGMDQQDIEAILQSLEDIDVKEQEESKQRPREIMMRREWW